jgi:hypothetical protein
MRFIHCPVIFFAMFMAPGSANGQASALATPEESQAPVTKLVLHPMAAPRPALRYQLLPPLLDRGPGNAAVLYNKVPAERTVFFMEFGKLVEKIEKWQQVPLGDPREKELRKPWESAFRGGSMFDILDQGARCETCDWQLPIRGVDFYSILLPEIQQTRNFARMLVAKARIEIAEKRFDAAERTLQTGYALGRHVAQGPCFVMSLVGAAITEIMSRDVEDWVQQPGAPNLYWALTWLPRPLVDLRPAIEGEMSSIYLSYPDLRNLETAQLSPEQWRRLLDTMVQRVLRWSSSGPTPSLPPSLVSAAAAVRAYPMAKRALIAWGRPAAEVEAMPVAQVVMIYTMRTYDEMRDDVFKWFAVPYAEGRAGAAQSEKDLSAAFHEGREALPIASMFLPAIQSLHFMAARNDRRIALLRIIEAIRLYGVAHGGQLPDELAEIKEVPIPNDPITGKSFLYQHNYGTAVLESPYIPGREQKHFGVRYEIQFAKKGN